MWHDNAVAQGYSGPCQGFSTKVIRGCPFFCFLLDLQGIEHASRKTDMQILISYIRGVD